MSIMKNTRRIALYGMMIALALIFSYVESQIPALFAVPGMKLGLTNVVVVTALYLLGDGTALAINLLRILLVSMMFGNGMSLAYSAAGGILSGLTMILLKHTRQFRMVTVSVAGGIAHNVGQILVAIVVLGTTRLAWYLLVLWFTGIGAGAVIGVIGYEVTRRLRRFAVKGTE